MKRLLSLLLSPCCVLPATPAGQDKRRVRLMTAPTPEARNLLMP